MTDSDYLRAWDLYDEKTETFKRYTLEIASVEQGVVTGEGGKKSRKPLIRFKGAKKPYAPGATVCKTISDIVGSPDPKRWPGTKVTLYVTKTVDKRRGKEMVDCIRVMPRAGTGPVEEIPERDEPVFDDQVASEAPPPPGKEG